MIFICISDTDREAYNDWIRENVDPTAKETFVTNREDPETGDKYCLISIVDNGSEYSEAMKVQFPYTNQLEGAYGSKSSAQIEAFAIGQVKVGGGKVVDLGMDLPSNADFFSSLIDAG